MDKAATRIKRKIVKIDEDKCDGCGLCVISCAEGALQIINGKARLISDKYCDSLGVCLSECPRGAISIEERQAEPYDEEAVQQHLAGTSPGQACGCPSAAVKQFHVKEALPCGCPSSAGTQFEPDAQKSPFVESGSAPSQLSHWPVQLTLVPPRAPNLHGADVLLAADCTAFACGGFHRNYLNKHALLVACPKLDNYEAHLAKLSEILSRSYIKSLTVLRMEVPCCAKLTRMATQAILSSRKEIPFKEAIISTQGEPVN